MLQYGEMKYKIIEESMEDLLDDIEFLKTKTSIADDLVQSIIEKINEKIEDARLDMIAGKTYRESLNEKD